jgi:hypothetical protein
LDHRHVFGTVDEVVDESQESAVISDKTEGRQGVISCFWLARLSVEQAARAFVTQLGEHVARRGHPLLAATPRRGVEGPRSNLAERRNGVVTGYGRQGIKIKRIGIGDVVVFAVALKPSD